MKIRACVRRADTREWECCQIKAIAGWVARKLVSGREAQEVFGKNGIAAGGVRSHENFGAQNDCRPFIARSRVTRSEYFRSPPIGMP